MSEKIAGEKILSVPDMACEHCEARVAKALADAGVPDFSVALERKEVRLPADAVEKALAALEGAGYPSAVKA